MRRTVAPGGKCSISRGVLTDCQFEAVFKPEGGAETQKPIGCFALFQTIDDHVLFPLYYDPTNPQRISTSWGQDLLANRLISQAVAVLAYFLLSCRQSQQLRRSLLAMATVPRAPSSPNSSVSPPAAISRRSISPGPTPTWGAAHRDSSRLPGTAQPFWLDQERKTLLAPAGPDGHAHALDRWLRPAVLTEEERQALGQALPTATPSMANRTEAAILRRVKDRVGTVRPSRRGVHAPLLRVRLIVRCMSISADARP